MVSKTRQLSIVFLITIAAFLSIEFTQAQTEPVDERPFIFGGLAWSPYGEWLAIGTSEGINLHRATELDEIIQLTQQEFVTALDWSPDGEVIASGDFDGNVQVWDAQTGANVFTFLEQTHVISGVVFSPDGTMLASISWDDTIVIRLVETGDVLQIIDVGDLYSNVPLTWSPNGDRIATIRANTKLNNCVWEIETGEPNLCWSDDFGASSMQWNPINETIATGGTIALVGLWNGIKGIRFWNAISGNLMGSFAVDRNKRSVNALAWSPDGLYLASNHSGDGQGQTIIWDVADDSRVAAFDGGVLTGDATYNNAMGWSSDGNTLASVSDDGRIYLWDMNTYEQIAVYEGYRSLILTD